MSEEKPEGIDGEVLTPIATLMARDPLKLTEVDLDRIVHQLRSQRAQFVAGNKTIGKPEAKKSANQKKSEQLAIDFKDLSLEDIMKGL